jgi:hypothetical protein
MKRLLSLAVLGMALLAGPVRADGCGCCGPGGFNLNLNLGCKWGGCWKCGVLAPWYNYWPLEAHFQTPAHPQYPFWPLPQTMPNGAPVAAPLLSTNPPPVPPGAPMVYSAQGGYPNMQAAPAGYYPGH